MGWVLGLGQRHAPGEGKGMGWVLGLGQGTGGLFWISLHKCAALMLSLWQTNASTVPEPSP